MKRITVLLAEDNKSVREDLRSLLEGEADIEIVGEAANGQEAVALSSRLIPDVIVMDIGMPLLNGFEALLRIREAGPESTRVLVLSAHKEEAYITTARALRAAGYLVKQSDSKVLARAIRQAHQGAPFICPSQPTAPAVLVP